MGSATERVAIALRGKGVGAQILEFPQGTRTAQDAAAAVGTSVAQIVKSLVFIADGQPVLVLASGANRVSLVKLAAVTTARAVKKADAAQVFRASGFPIGGVPPIGHRSPLHVYIDRDLMPYDIVYAAAGTPNSVFAIPPPMLQHITQGQIVDLRED